VQQEQAIMHELSPSGRKQRRTASCSTVVRSLYNRMNISLLTLVADTSSTSLQCHIVQSGQSHWVAI